jgi:hypothetical protein
MSATCPSDQTLFDYLNDIEAECMKLLSLLHYLQRPFSYFLIPTSVYSPLKRPEYIAFTYGKIKMHVEIDLFIFW